MCIRDRQEPKQDAIHNRSLAMIERAERRHRRKAIAAVAIIALDVYKRQAVYRPSMSLSSTSRSAWVYLAIRAPRRSLSLIHILRQMPCRRCRSGA